jgi:hypothetical protein
VTSSPFVIDYRGRFAFAAAPEAVWARIMAVDRFERWWGWLSELRVEGARADNGDLQAGSVLRGVVAPPLPYRMRLCVAIERCRPPSSIDAAVHGDLEGRAGLRLEPLFEGTCADVTWTIEMMQRPMRLAARVAHPVFRWGHDKVVDATVQSFTRVLERERQTVNPGGPPPFPRPGP